MDDTPRKNIYLADGREIRLIKLYRVETYAGLLEGVPSRSMNDEIIHRLGIQAKDLFGNRIEPPLPVRIPYRVQLWPAEEWVPLHRETGLLPAHSASLDKRDDLRIKEVLPGIASLGLFISAPLKNDPEDGDCSHLAALWFQHDPYVVLEQEPMSGLIHVRWDELATSWRF